MKQEANAPEFRTIPYKKAGRQFSSDKASRCQMFIALFVGGWIWPKLNAYTGYGTLFRDAQELSKEYKIKEIRTWNLPVLRIWISIWATPWMSFKQPHHQFTTANRSSANKKE